MYLVLIYKPVESSSINVCSILCASTMLSKMIIAHLDVESECHCKLHGNQAESIILGNGNFRFVQEWQVACLFLERKFEQKTVQGTGKGSCGAIIGSDCLSEVSGFGSLEPMKELWQFCAISDVIKDTLWKIIREVYSNQSQLETIN